ncbi:unnamed protein product [Cuscuta campestris]|uniref:Uncharacterized protein n=1 Tax=Cuscuta campestris TaxID=132261 RepID=A0A484N1V7_9ASTE|nr:unnamed protein product [Cuscuta campestris]
MTSDKVASECILKLYHDGQVETINKTDSQQLKQYVVHFTAGNTENYAQYCNIATFVPTSEDTPLKRAEWIKYLGVFSNQESRSNLVYDAIKGNYLCLSKAATTKSSSFKPTVAWVEYDNNEVWSFTKEDYKLKIVQDAGGVNVDESINKITYNMSMPDDIEDFHAILCTVDVVIDETYTSDPTAYNVSTFLGNVGVEDQSCFTFISNRSLWRYDKRVQNYTVLDIIEALFPSESYKTTYFRNIAKGEGIISISPEMCERDVYAAMEPTIVACE